MKKSIVIVLCALTLVFSICAGALSGFIAAKLGGSDEQVQQTTQPEESTAPEIHQEFTGTELTVAGVAQKCTQSVVNITIKGNSPGYTGGSSYSQEIEAHGTGVIIRSDGYIATCYHVVEGADKITVTLDDQTEYSATLVGYDDRFDLAVIRVNATGMPAVKIGNSDAIRSGEGIVVIGNPLGEFGSSVTAGVLSAPARELTIEGTPLRLMQMDAAVNPGNSGGALFNMRGELIGIVNAKIAASGIEGIAFAIPWNSISDKVDSIISSGNTGKKPVLGVSTKSSVCYVDGTKRECVEITSVRDSSAAYDAGLNIGDYLLSADGKALKSNDDLTLAVKYHSPGDQMVFEVFRNNQIIKITVTLGES